MSGVVIIGAGHAGFQCADSLRKGGYQGPVTLVDAAADLPYQRPPLSKSYLLEAADRERLAFRTASYYPQQGITLVLGRRVLAIDAAAHRITLDDGQSLGYEQLVLAPGARVRQLTVAPALAQRICYLKTLDDIDRIRSELTQAQQLVVVGGGFIALEFAAVARKLGKSVRLLVRGPRLLQNALSPELADYLQQVHTRAGVEISLNTEISHYACSGQGLALTTDAGEQLQADLLVAGVGVVPEVELARAAGLACSDGIEVDAYCRSSAANIYAAGDAVSQFHPLYGRRVRLESVQNAVDQGKAVAAAILGQGEAYDAVPWFWSDQYDIKLQMAGLLAGYDRVIWRGGADAGAQPGRFSLCYLQGDRLLAVHSVNKPGDHMAARKLLAAKISPSAEQLSDEAFKLTDLLKPH